MTTAEIILNKLRAANSIMFVIKVNADLLNTTIPEYLSNDIRLELDNLRESLYIVDRDVTAWMEIARTPWDGGTKSNSQLPIDEYESFVKRDRLKNKRTCS